MFIPKTFRAMIGVTVAARRKTAFGTGEIFFSALKEFYRLAHLKIFPGPALSDHR